ncbi:MAG: DUF6245 family protein [Pseudonocardiaceae bacterium]
MPPPRTTQQCRWQVLRTGTPLRLMAQNQEVRPIPLAAAHVATGLQVPPVSLSNLLGIAPSFPTWEECTKPGMVHNSSPAVSGCLNMQDDLA